MVPQVHLDGKGRSTMDETSTTASASPYAGTSPVAPLGPSGGVVTVVEGQTFCLSDAAGDISAALPHGLFVLDTRILSRWSLHLDGHPLEPLTSEVTELFHATFVGRGHAAEGHADADLVVFRDRHVGWGMREEIEVTNHGLEPRTVELELRCDVDFADLFAVKESRVVRAGEYGTERLAGALRFVHRLDGRSQAVEVAAPQAVVTPGALSWSIPLAPGARWSTCVVVTTSVDDEPIAPRFNCDIAAGDAEPVRRIEEWHAEIPTVSTDHDGLAQAVRRAGRDLGALRIFDPDHPEVPILAAGAPWFMTVFGRDSLLTAWMTLLADHRLARGVLETLARFQGSDVVPEREEQPGKILHEMRFGRAGDPTLRAGQVYYGSIDATPLFVMLLGELHRWHPFDGALEALLPNADRALDWIVHHGDLDGDGFVEYARSTTDSLVNQGWKDSWDAIRHADGRLARGPIALCEVQGYVYAAYLARAHLAHDLGDAASAATWHDRAQDLRRRFNEEFWLEDQGWFALGLDGDKQPIAALASNMGHCLWTGIVDPDKAASVARHMVGDDLFSGWGIRTLGRSMTAYNPVSYHNGSVWPHDNALGIAGLVRYGFIDEAHRVMEGQLAAADTTDGRLPELFAGFERGRPGRPAAYPTSCSPQAWASAAPLLWLRSLLRFDPWSGRDAVYVDPALPPWLGRVSVDGIDACGGQLRVDVEDGRVEVSGAGRCEVVRAPRPPLDDVPWGDAADR